jgi:Tol biopolymer transport system component
VPKVTEEPNAETPAGGLIHQDPEHGTKVKKASEVKLVYSTGAAEIVFTQGGNIFVVAIADGAKPRPIVNTDELEEEASTNKDATLVAFRKGTAEKGQIFTIDPAKPLSLQAVTADGFDDNRPAFSPDGKTIAFVRGATGGGDRDLCFVATGGGQGACIEDKEKTVTRPVWSSDGKVIFVSGNRPGELQTELIRYASSVPNSAKPADWTDHGAVTDSLHGQAPNEHVFYSAISRDGKQIAFTASWGRPVAHLHIAPLKDGVIGKPKAFPGIAGCDVAWRPDGAELAIAQRDDFCSSNVEGRLVLVDPKKPAELKLIGPGGSPNFAPGSLGK